MMLKEKNVDITIAYTNDTHGLFRKREFVEAVSRLKTTTQPDLLLDGGDALQQGNISYSLGPELATMYGLGYAAMAVGGREFHEIPHLMQTKIGEISPVLLAANLNHRRRNAQPDKDMSSKDGQTAESLPWPILSSVILEKKGIKIGIIGLMPYRPWKRGDQIVNSCTRSFLPAKFVPPIKAVNREVNKFREAVDLVILLSHCEPKDNFNIALEVRGIDVIFGAHLHSKLPLPALGQHTPIIHYFEDNNKVVQKGRSQNVAASIVRLTTNHDGHAQLSALQIHNIFTSEIIESV